MNRSPTASGIIFITAVIALHILPAAAAQNPVPSLTQHPTVTVGKDPNTWRRDPFIISKTKGSSSNATSTRLLKSDAAFQSQEQEIRLQGIMQVDKAFHALINGRSLKTGDTIAGVTIKEINRHQIVVLNARKEKIVYDVYQGRIDRGKQ